MNAQSLLKDCSAILVARGKQYGKAEEMFSIAAKLFSGQLQADVTPSEVCLLMAQMKLGRIANGNTEKDTYLDAVNYIALAYEIHVEP